jgi:alkylation response protein AidB-like acyl-CoA dehydrogenase
MNFILTDDQQAMRDSLRRFLNDEPAPSWASLCELGVMAALLPQARGGIGGGGSDIALVFEELGRACVASPALSCVMASTCIGLEDELLRGNVIASALYEEAGRYDHHWCEAVATGDGSQIKVTGEKSVVPDAGIAASFLVSARLDGKPSLMHVPAEAHGVSFQARATMDGGQIGHVTFNGAAGRMLDANPGRMIASGLLALGAEALGMMDAVRDMTVDYLKQRKQFGKPLSGFQVLQHRLADMAMAIEQVRSSVLNAATAYDQHDGKLSIESHALKAQAGEIGRLVAEEAIQLHGGIGMTQEYALGKYAKRLIMMDHLLGDADWHLMQFAEVSKRETAQ